MSQLEKVYEPQRFEPHWAQWWIDRNLFVADARSSRPMFSLAIPPPNVTGSLHMGHMLEHTLIDVSVRWHRMCGFNTLWLPGMDHAGIATQMVVERRLAQEGIDRRAIGREEFECRVWQWKAESGGAILKQMVRIGASCDWSRERFTLDPGLSRAVREVFVRLYEKGLLYRGEYMVNWCPACHTAISDLEVVHDQVEGNLWHIRYPVKGEPGRFLEVATSRPETMLGDTAVAINAKDERYFDLHDRSVVLPLMHREIPIILDDLADPKFGTGVVKVTPAHDPNDFEAGKRHNLPHVKVINEEAKMTAEAGAYAGLDRFEARKRILADLDNQGLLAKTEAYSLSVGKCDRSGTIVEPLVSRQWFMKMKPLAEPAIEAVEKGDIEITPETWRQTYFHWMRNIRDWCVSRQLWWGHRIPAWYCDACGETIVAREEPTACSRCGSGKLTRDPDVLDTWFSSGLWPFTTLGWPDDTADLRMFYPTTLMIMGYEILFFWCARMTMMGLEFMKAPPFRRVYIHGIVRNADKKKMSKTRGNTVDPLDITEKYGTDAVRMALLQSAAPGADIIWTEDKLPSARAFANKIWNAARFLFLNMERSGVEPTLPAAATPETLEDRWIASRLNACAEVVNRAIEQNRYHEAAQSLWHFFWGEFCDWYVELKKLRFREGSGLDTHWANLLYTFDQALRLLHPAMPFITEELWQRLAAETPGRPVSIALASFPRYRAEATDADAERDMALLQEIITVARNLRAEIKVDPKLVLQGTLYSDGPARALASSQIDAIAKLANVTLELKSGAAPKGTGVQHATPDFDLVLELPAAQSGAQRKRLEKEIEQLEKVVANSERQLGDEKFLGRAPAHVVDGIRAKLADYRSQLARSRATLDGLSAG
jgi:valyl-tRNA synthetase